MTLITDIPYGDPIAYKFAASGGIVTLPGVGDSVAGGATTEFDAQDILRVTYDPAHPGDPVLRHVRRLTSPVLLNGTALPAKIGGVLVNPSAKPYQPGDPPGQSDIDVSHLSVYALTPFVKLFYVETLNPLSPPPVVTSASATVTHFGPVGNEFATTGLEPAYQQADAFLQHAEITASPDGKTATITLTTWPYYDDVYSRYHPNPYFNPNPSKGYPNYLATGIRGQTADGSPVGYYDFWINDVQENGVPYPQGGTLLTCVALTNLTLAGKAESWPGGAPVAGMPVSVHTDTWRVPDGRHGSQAAGAVPLPLDAGLTDSLGRTETSGAIIPRNFNGIWLGATRFYAKTTPAFLCANRLDPREWTDTSQFGATGNLGPHGPDMFARIQALVTPPLVQVSRQASLTIIDGLHDDPAKWQGAAFYNENGGPQLGAVQTFHNFTTRTPILPISRSTPYGAPTGSTDPAQAGNVQITSQPDGLHLLWPAATAQPHFIYSAARAFLPAGDGGRQRAFRNYRWLRLRLKASAPCQLSFTLHSWEGVLPFNIDTSQPIEQPWTCSWGLSLQAGDNTFTLDLAGGDPFPWDIIYNDGPEPRAGVVPGALRVANPRIDQAGGGPHPTYAPVYDQIGEWTLRSFAPPNADAALDDWSRNDCWWLRLDGLTPGVEYVLEEVAAYDRNEAGRTTLRVGGSADPVPLPGRAAFTNPFEVLEAAAFRVLVNGRPALAVPADPFLGSPLDPTTALPMTLYHVSDLLARWQDRFDGGCGAWTVTTLRPDLAAALPAPAVQLIPATVTETGFQLEGRVATPLFQVEPGFDVTVSPSIELRWEFGGQIEGLILDAKFRQPGQGQTVSSRLVNAPRADLFLPGDAILPFYDQYGRLVNSDPGSTLPLVENGVFPQNTTAEPWLYPPAPVAEGVVSTDNDGYFALPGLHQPVWDITFQRPPYEATHRPSHQLAAIAGKSALAWSASLPHKNVAFYFILGQLRAFIEQDMAQDYATGRILRVKGDDRDTLTAEAREGWQGLSGAPVRSAAILDQTGAARPGQNPSLWITHETGLASLVYVRPSDSMIVRADSRDGLQTVGDESMPLFSRAGGAPDHFQDTSTGLTYLFAAFPNASGGEDLVAARQDAQGNLLTWAGGQAEKTIAANVDAAGAPRALPNRYVGAQDILLIHGDRRWHGTDGGEVWTEIP